MAFARVQSAQTHLLTPRLVSVETDISFGLHSFSIVGLPDKAVEEAKDRVSAAIKNSGFTSPKSKNQKLTVSLAPAEMKKEGPAFDLPIALSYLLSSEEIRFDPNGKLFLGELSLDGSLRPVRGVLPVVNVARNKKITELYVPKENAREAALVGGISVYGVSTLSELIEHLSKNTLVPEKKTKIEKTKNENEVDFSDIRGQETAKRALLIAASGGHNIALFGPPGTGKTMLARAFSGIMPALSEKEMFEVTSIHSVAGVLDGAIVTDPPFRAPHHTSSHISLVGGGTYPKPGEVTLAHRGVLFLDEFPEFEKRSIEALREPLEDGIVSVSRAKGRERFPARFTLLAAMNPCPCGNRGSSKRCICKETDLARYERKISGPIIDRIDMWISVGPIAHETLRGKSKDKENIRLRKAVETARNIQKKRFAKKSISLNSHMSVRDIERLVRSAEDAVETLEQSAKALGLSARGYHKVLRLSQTIADLSGEKEIKKNHVLEALQYRPRVFS